MSHVAKLASMVFLSASVLGAGETASAEGPQRDRATAPRGESSTVLVLAAGSGEAAMSDDSVAARPDARRQPGFVPRPPGYTWRCRQFYRCVYRHGFRFCRMRFPELAYFCRQPGWGGPFRGEPSEEGPRGIDRDFGE